MVGTACVAHTSQVRGAGIQTRRGRFLENRGRFPELLLLRFDRQGGQHTNAVPVTQSALLKKHIDSPDCPCLSDDDDQAFVADEGTGDDPDGRHSPP